jgi:hypothetical protein
MVLIACRSMNLSLKIKLSRLFDILSPITNALGMTRALEYIFVPLILLSRWFGAALENIYL